MELKVISKDIDISEVSFEVKLLINGSEHTIQGAKNLEEGHQAIEYTMDGESLWEACEKYNDYDCNEIEEFIDELIYDFAYPKDEDKKYAKGGLTGKTGYEPEPWMWDYLSHEIEHTRKPTSIDEVRASFNAAEVDEEVLQLISYLPAIKAKDLNELDGKLSGNIQYYVLYIDGVPYLIDTQGFDYARYVSRIDNLEGADDDWGMLETPNRTTTKHNSLDYFLLPEEEYIDEELEGGRVDYSTMKLVSNIDDTWGSYQEMNNDLIQFLQANYEANGPGVLEDWEDTIRLLKEEIKILKRKSYAKGGVPSWWHSFDVVAHEPYSRDIEFQNYIDFKLGKQPIKMVKAYGDISDDDTDLEITFSNGDKIYYTYYMKYDPKNIFKYIPKTECYIYIAESGNKYDVEYKTTGMGSVIADLGLTYQEFYNKQGKNYAKGGDVSENPFSIKGNKIYFFNSKMGDIVEKHHGKFAKYKGFGLFSPKYRKILGDFLYKKEGIDQIVDDSARGGSGNSYHKQYGWSDGSQADKDWMEEVDQQHRDMGTYGYARGGQVNKLARKLINESDYYYELEKEGNSPEYIFEKAQEEAEEMLKKGEGFAKGGMTDDDFPSDDQEKLAAEHIKEAKRGKAKITNMGWGSGPDFIESKTDKGILYSDIEDGKVSHEWEYDDEEYAKGGVTKPRLKKGDKVEIYGKRWFQKSYGNTYHVTKVYVNGVALAPKV